MGVFRRAIGVVAIACVMSGCGTDASTLLRTLGSWAATGAMLGQAWADGATPRAYTERTLERAQRELATQARERGTLPTAQRTQATPVTERVLRGLRDLAWAVRAHDRAAVRRLADTLGADARRLSSLDEPPS
jgi:hypothetical protein